MAKVVQCLGSCINVSSPTSGPLYTTRKCVHSFSLLRHTAQPSVCHFSALVLTVSSFDLQNHFTMRALSMLESAGIPLMSSLGRYTGRIENILQISVAIRPPWPPIEILLRDWLRPLSKAATFRPTWNSLLQITRLLNLHDLAERAETCLKATTVDHQHKESVAKEGKKILIFHFNC